MERNIEKINSKENKFIKYAKALHKTAFSEKENVFILEGARIIEEALRQTLKIKAAFFTEEFYSQNKKENYFQKILSVSPKNYYVSEKTLKSISQLETPAGLLILVQKKLFGVLAAEIKAPVIVYLDNIKDPGNMGTILRTALALGVKDVILSREAVNPYNPKVIRASSGAIFQLNLYSDKEREKIIELKNKGFKIYATSSHAASSVLNFKAQYPCVIIFGEEAKGVADDLKRVADNILKLPLKKNVESLNVSTAAAIFLYELMKPF